MRFPIVPSSTSPGSWFPHLSRLLRAERRLRGTRRGTRKSSPWRQAVYGLVWFLNGGDIANLGRGFGLSRTTSYRYLNEVVDVLAEQAPDLKEALDRARADGRPHLILDGTLTSIDRVGEKKTSVKGKEIDAWYSGKARAFAANLQGLMTPGGFPIWISDALPGSTHDFLSNAGAPFSTSISAPAEWRPRQSGARSHLLRAGMITYKSLGLPH
ncbi:hypothetical protein ACTWPT_16730 [Nonomuraea sp. 3N208]|uniref:hypothetical protein n=1 Tax=Nonomuraea sp. 3N208 TaxID=3457421 RepID=UPI003FCE9F73